MFSVTYTSKPAYICFDLSKPGALLASYEFLLRKQDRNRKATLYASAKRLVQVYENVVSQLAMINADRKRSLGAWFRKRSEAAKLVRKLDSIRSDLVDWVSKTLAHFVSDRLCQRFIGW